MCAAVSAWAQPPIFTSNTELVVLNVVVVDPTQQLVTDLLRPDFEVLEDDVPQEIAHFAAGGVPLDLALLIDTSASMAGALPLANQAAAELLATLGPDDRATIISFSTRAQIAHPWSSIADALLHGINLTVAHGNTSLYDALYMTLRQFDRGWRDTREVRRQAIVVLSDGGDNHSLTSLNDLVTTIRRRSVAIYIISLEGSRRLMAKEVHQRRVAGFEMARIARETGARTFVPRSGTDLTNVYGIIAGDLGHQYSLAYAPTTPRQDGAFRRLAVRVVGRPALLSRSRSGYLAAPPNRTGSPRR